MLRRAARLAVLLVSLAALLATTTPPASAATVKVGLFAGTAITGPRGYPCVPLGTTDCLTDLPDPEVKLGVKGVPWVNLHSYGYNIGFTFFSDVCTKVSVGTKLGITANCTMTASGTIEGYCGLSSALGTVTIVNPDKGTTSVPFKWIDLGGLLVVTGEDPSGSVQIVILAVDATPTPLTSPGQSCLTANAQVTTIAGLFEVLVK